MVSAVSRSLLVRRSGGKMSPNEQHFDYLPNCNSLAHQLPCTLSLTERGLYIFLDPPHQGCDLLPIETIRNSRFEEGIFEVTTDDGHGIRRKEYFSAVSKPERSKKTFIELHQELNRQSTVNRNLPTSVADFVGDPWTVQLTSTHSAIFELERKVPPNVLEVAQAAAQPRLAKYVLASHAIAGGVEPSFAELDQGRKMDIFRRFEAAHAFLHVRLGLVPEFQMILREYDNVDRWVWIPALESVTGSWPGLSPSPS